jgi:carbamoyltransferase
MMIGRTTWRFAHRARTRHGVAASLIASGHVVGWYQGRMEWGARALGNRSILADPRRSDVRELINTKIKFRERFPSVRAVDRRGGAARVLRGRGARPVHAAGVSGARRQARDHSRRDARRWQRTTADRECANQPTYYALIKEFEKITGVPVVLNTSFNENEPIVDTPEQALDCFMRTRMDAIVLHNTIVRRQPAERDAAVATAR